MQFVLCFLLICIIVVPVPFVCCSVKLPLARPTSFCLFLSILLHTPAWEGVTAWRFCCRVQPNQNKLFCQKLDFLRENSPLKQSAYLAVSHV